MTLKFLPRPRVLELREGQVAGDGLELRTEEDPSLPPQGYALEIAADGIQIRHADAAGLRYAEQALGQLEVQSAGTLPLLAIRDWPDFPVRGYMLDISRDRVPNRDTLERIVDVMALLRLNHLQLYMEHTFEYADHEEVWRDASPMTPDDLHWLDTLCRESGIELVPNQNCFGHMARWLQHDAYRHLAETPDGWDTKWGAHMPPGVLAPDDASLRFVRGLLAELLPNFKSRRVNIDCDETFELGRGRSAAAVKKRGRGRVYLEFLLKIIEPLAADGYDVQFWGDILRSHPELVKQLPEKNATALAWHYEAPLEGASLPPELMERFAEFGLDEAFLRGFAGQVPAFADAGFPFWVCPGTSSWNSLVGRWPNARTNLLDAATVGLDAGAGGMLITDWGDNGHLQPPSVSWLPLAYGASLAWCAETNRDLEMAPLLDAFVFEDEAEELGAALELLGGVYAKTGLLAANASPLHTGLIGGGILGSWGKANAKGVKAVLADLADAEERISRAQPAAVDGDITREELGAAIRLARHGAWRVAREAKLRLRLPSKAKLATDLRESIDAQSAAWNQRSRPGGLADSLARLERGLTDYA
jgi:hypothetical protein